MGDAWQELSGWDGRFVRTFRALVRQPGGLTLEVLQGRRAQYIAPVRLYLFASVLYFLLAAASPTVRVPDAETGRLREVKIGIWASDTDPGEFTAEERADFERLIEKSHWFFKPMFESVRDGGRSLQARVVPVMPKVLFALVPVFAAILALFYWGRPYLQHLIFALHLQTVIFIALATAEASKFTNSPQMVALVAVPALLFIAVYALRGLRRVYQSSWPATIAKAAAVGAVYGLVSGTVIFMTVASLAFFL